MITPALQQNRLAFHDQLQSSQVTIDSQASESHPVDSGHIGSNSQTGANSQTPTNSQSSQQHQPSSQQSTSRRSPKSALKRYEESQPLECGQANGSRLVSSRRHVIEDIVLNHMTSIT